MYAVEFETVIHDKLIKVPEVFNRFEHKKIRVLLLDPMEDREDITLPEGFYHPLQATSYQLATREEIYEH